MCDGKGSAKVPERYRKVCHAQPRSRTPAGGAFAFALSLDFVFAFELIFGFDHSVWFEKNTTRATCSPVGHWDSGTGTGPREPSSKLLGLGKTRPRNRRINA